MRETLVNGSWRVVSSGLSCSGCNHCWNFENHWPHQTQQAHAKWGNYQTVCRCWRIIISTRIQVSCSGLTTFFYCTTILPIQWVKDSFVMLLLLWLKIIPSAPCLSWCFGLAEMKQCRVLYFPPGNIYHADSSTSELNPELGSLWSRQAREVLSICHFHYLLFLRTSFLSWRRNRNILFIRIWEEDEIELSRGDRLAPIMASDLVQWRLRLEVNAEETPSTTNLVRLGKRSTRQRPGKGLYCFYTRSYLQHPQTWAALSAFLWIWKLCKLFPCPACYTLPLRVQLHSSNFTLLLTLELILLRPLLCSPLKMPTAYVISMLFTEHVTFNMLLFFCSPISVNALSGAQAHDHLRSLSISSPSISNLWEHFSILPTGWEINQYIHSLAPC